MESSGSVTPPERVRAELGAILRALRDASRRTLSEVAGEAGCSPAHLSEVERGRKDVSTDLLVAIAYALRAPVADVYAELGERLRSDAPGAGALWSRDPQRQLYAAAATLPIEALRSVAHFSAFLATAEATPTRRRIGFTPHREDRP